MFYIAYNLWLSWVISGPVCTDSVVYIVLMFLCYRLRVVPYALLSVCANLFYCLVKYILANIREIIGVVKTILFIWNR